MNRISRPLVALGLALAVAACDEAPYKSQTQDMSGESEVWDRMMVATKDAPLMLEVYGDRVYDDGLLIDILPDVVSGAVDGRRIDVTINPDAPSHPHIRIVFATNMTEASTSASLCRHDPDQQPVEGNARFTMVFCAGDKYMRGVTGELLQGQGPDSDDFPKLLDQMAGELLKRRSSSER